VHASRGVVVEEVFELVRGKHGRLTGLDHRLVQRQPPVIQTLLGRQTSPATSSFTPGFCNGCDLQRNTSLVPLIGGVGFWSLGIMASVGRQAYNGGLGAEPPVGSKSRAPGQVSEVKPPPSLKLRTFWLFGPKAGRKFAPFPQSLPLPPQPHLLSSYLLSFFLPSSFSQR